VEALYSAIHSKALIQYVTPFTSVNLATMATAFATNVGCALPFCHLVAILPSSACRLCTGF
jgi:hypothetical protein